MKRLVSGLLAFLVWAAVVRPAADPQLEHAFRAPPDDARPWVYWFWSDGNLTRAGITADLEAMQRVGIGGVLIMDVDQNVPPGLVSFMTPAWRELLAFAVSEAGRLGLQIDLNNDAGWTGSGGPWVDAEHSMQKVVWSETRVAGPRRFDGTIAQPETLAGFYRDIAVLAFPTPESETKTLHDVGVQVTASRSAGFAGERLVDGDRATGTALQTAARDAEPVFIQLAFAEPFTARSLAVTPAPGAKQRVLCRLEASPDGTGFSEVAQLSPGGAPAVFEPVNARVFRLVFTGPAAAEGAILLNEIELSSIHRIEKYAAKSGLGLVASPANPPSTDAGVSVARERVIDLTARLRAGQLGWDVPPGEWTIVRFGHTSTGKTNYPSPAAGKGLEVDKLSRVALDRHFDGFLGKVFDDAAQASPSDHAGASLATPSGADERRPYKAVAGFDGPGPAAAGPATSAITTVHVDSWEVGYQNWTPGFRAAFEERRGYDPLPWLPAFTGRVVEDEALSERFLWDVRRTISELLNENYAARIAERAHAAGRRFSVQAYRYGPFDCLSYAGRADLPIGEFWMTRDPLTQHPSVKTMTSAGHIYGRNLIAAEAFTASDALGRQRNHPFSLKAIGDAAFVAGINHFIFHRYSMQPWVDDRKPGMTMGPWGVEYERTATWWEQTKPWHEYLARCQYLLRQGRFVADLCYLQSEEGFNNPATPAEIRPAVPEGYDFDFCSDEIVRTRMTVENGRLVLPGGSMDSTGATQAGPLTGGMSYRVLVLPSQRLMTPALLRKIRDLVRAGAVVYGPPPYHSPSLSGYPACDTEVRQLVEELWGDDSGRRAVKPGRAFVPGKVTWGPTLEQLLAELRLEPDFAYRNTHAVPAQARPPVRAVHRALSDRDVYFVANLGDATANIVASFRVGSLRPELWRADSGVIEPAAVYDVVDGRTRVSLELAPRGSVFVVFRHGDAPREDRIVTIKRNGATLRETSPVPLAPAPENAGPFTPPIGSFTMAVWVNPAIDTTLPAENFTGTAAYSVPRNDVLFPPPVHEVLGLPDAAGVGFAVGRNGVTVSEHGDHHFPATLVYRQPISGWTHMAVVFDRGTPSLYLNGEWVRSGLKTLRTVYGGVGLPHGREVEPFRGEHSAVRQFDRALGVAEIRELMRSMPKIPVAATKQTNPGCTPARAAPIDFDVAGAAWLAEPGRYEFARADGTARTINVSDVPAAFTIEGGWTVRFPPGWGAPATIELPRLVSWSEHLDAGVRYFSGTATYEKEFEMPAEFMAKNRRCRLDLGDVQVIAEVRLNGRELGTLWKPPFRIDVTPALRRGRNRLEIRVTNLWVNRLIGDEQLPADREWTKVPRRGGWALKAYPDWFLRGERSPVGRVTFTTWKHYEKDAPLLPSGLLGPVTLETEVRVDGEGSR